MTNVGLDDGVTDGASVGVLDRPPFRHASIVNAMLPKETNQRSFMVLQNRRLPAYGC